MPTNNAINLSAQGVPYYDGMSIFTAAPITEYSALIGDANGNIVSSDPTVTVGNPFVSNGTSATPTFSTTATVNQITIIDLPVNPSDGVNKDYADLIAAGFVFKGATAASTTGSDLNSVYNNGASGVGATLTNAGAMVAFTLDGVSLILNDRVLIKDQTTSSDNGIYYVTIVGDGATNWEITRTTDYDTVVEIVPGTLVPVVGGTLNGGTFWDQTETVTTIGTDPILFSRFGISSSEFLLKVNNLSDVANVATSRTNLGLTNVAIQNVTQYTTLVGGAANAITSIGPGNTGDLYISTGAATDPNFITPTASTGLTVTSSGSAFNYALDIPVTVPNGGTGSTTLTGLLIGNGTSAVTGNPITNHDVLVGGTANAVTSVTPSAASGIPLISQGTSSDPIFGTALVAGGGTGATTLTGLLTGNGTSAITGNAITNHDVLVGGTSNTVTSIAPSATSGIALVSQGSSVDPIFGTVVVAGGGSGATTLTGVLTGNGTGAFTATAITQHDVLVGAASNTITSIAPTATSGVPLVSAGAAADPIFGTAVVAGGGTGKTSTTAYAVLCGGTTTTAALQSIASVGTSGQVLTSNGAGALPTFQNPQTTTSWTPGVAFAGATTGITYTTQQGHYTQVGNMVFFSFILTLLNKGSATGVATITGFPVNIVGAPAMEIMITETTGLTYTATYVSSFLNTSGATTSPAFALNQFSPSAGTAQFTDTAFANNARLAASGFYFVL